MASELCADFFTLALTLVMTVAADISHEHFWLSASRKRGSWPGPTSGWVALGETPDTVRGGGGRGALSGVEHLAVALALALALAFLIYPLGHARKAGQDRTGQDKNRNLGRTGNSFSWPRFTSQSSGSSKL